MSNTRLIETKIVNVDKSVALSFLASNKTNRVLNKSRVLKYAEQMIDGKWMFNGQSIIIGSNGALLDGQHRLSAIAEHNLEVPLMFCFNVPPESFDTIDTGDSRTGADVLTMNGFKPGTAKTLSTCVRTDLCMKHSGSIAGSASIQSKLSPKSIASAVSEDAGYVDAVAFVESFGKKNLPLPAGSLSFLVYRFFTIDKEFSEEWMKCFISGVGITREDDLRAWLRNKFWREFNATFRRPLRHKLGFVIKAWSTDRAGRTIKYENNMYRDPVDAYKYIILPSDKKVKTN